MKKHLLALAALATVSGLATAQSVTMYGTIDLGVTSANKYSATSTAAGTKTSMETGGIAPSVWGFRGSEDLGGGLKAGFALEGHLDPSTGAKTDLSGGGTLFARQSNLSLSGSFGTVTLGRQFTPAVLAFAATDPRGLRESYSGLQLFAVTAPTSDNTSTHGGIFASNAVSYSLTLGQFSGAVLHALGEQAGDSGKNSFTSYGLTYRGPVVISSGYETSKKTSTDTDDTEKFTIGAAYTVGSLTVKANSIDYKVKATGAKSEVFGVGGEYKVSASGNVTAAYYEGKAKATAGAKAKSYVVSYEHSLSKRTTAYAQYVTVDQGSASTNLNLLAVATVANQNATQVNVGIKHSF